jgi:hypothetical protein
MRYCTGFHYAASLAAQAKRKFATLITDLQVKVKTGQLQQDAKITHAKIKNTKQAGLGIRIRLFLLGQPFT